MAPLRECHVGYMMLYYMMVYVFFTPSKENKSNNQTRKTEPSKNSVIDLTE